MGPDAAALRVTRKLHISKTSHNRPSSVLSFPFPLRESKQLNQVKVDDGLDYLKERRREDRTDGRTRIVA